MLSNDCMGRKGRSKYGTRAILGKTDTCLSAGQTHTVCVTSCIAFKTFGALKRRRRSFSFPGAPLDAVIHEPGGAAHPPTVTSLSRVYTAAGSVAFLFSRLQKRRRPLKNGAGGDSGAVPIDRLVLRLPADRLVVFRLRHLQIRNPARQEEGVAARLRAFPGTTGSLALRTRPRGTFHANPPTFRCAFDADTANTAVLP